MRLIDADAIPEGATAISTDGRLFVAWSEIVNAPTIDAVPVVRCKDCRIGKPSYVFGDGWVFCKNNNQTHQDTHFCSYGERKDGDG